jgi:Zn-dependent M32 family carboxypeptidase
MSVQQLERSLARLKIETDEKYDALWKRYTKEKEQYEITIAHLNKMLEMEKQLCKHIQEREQLKDDRRKVIDEKFDELLNKLKETAGPTGFTLIAKDLREALVSGQTDCGCQQQETHRFTRDAFEGLFRIITERRTPSKQDVKNIEIIREGLISNGIFEV